jgi:hypothetical protein
MMMISARTSLQLTRRVVSRATGSALASQSSAYVNGSGNNNVTAKFLSTQVPAGSKMPTPGIGAAKTSTGLVRYVTLVSTSLYVCDAILGLVSVVSTLH